MTCPHVSVAHTQPPSPDTPVYKDACTQCFDSADDQAGIFVCLHCFNAGCASHARHHGTEARPHPLAVWLHREEPPAAPAAPTPVTRLAIGTPGGVPLPGQGEGAPTWHSRLHCLACDRTLSPTEVPPQLAATAQAVVSHVHTHGGGGGSGGAWEPSPPAPCAHSLAISQLHAPPQLPKHCQKCEISDNLWLCLTCGHVGCGRRQFDGSGGNGHASHHYEVETGRNHHVVVKLGTITPEGSADVNCYACDKLVVVPTLPGLLSHLGVPVADQRKTLKSLAEMELDQNLALTLASTYEDGLEVDPLSGPGLQGMVNLGATCYVASILQVLFALPDWQLRYAPALAPSHSCPFPPSCLTCQLRRVADALVTGRYPPGHVSPALVKALLAGDHPEFRGPGQQDAFEFLQHTLAQVSRLERGSGADPTRTFHYLQGQLLQCLTCQRVRRATVDAEALSVPVPLLEGELATYERGDGDGGGPTPPTQVPLERCLQAAHAPQPVQFACPHCGGPPRAATLTQSFHTYPDLLILHTQRFVLENWVPRKLNVALTVPDPIPLDAYRELPPTPGEQTLPDEAGPGPGGGGPTPNPALLEMLEGAGFSRVAASKAALATGNADPEAAMNWLLGHLDDADLNTAVASALAPAADTSALEGMGFSAAQARQALREVGGSVEAAVEWLFSHPDATGEGETAPASPAALPVDGGSARYRLVAFVVHKGGSVHAGHYVAYIHRDSKWVLYNDRRVTPSSRDWASSGYVYILQREA